MQWAAAILPHNVRCASRGGTTAGGPIPAVSATCFKQVAALENAVLPSLVISGLQELFEVFKSELQARSRARLFKRWAIGLVVACLVLLGVNAATVSTW